MKYARKPWKWKFSDWIYWLLESLQCNFRWTTNLQVFGCQILCFWRKWWGNGGSLKWSTTHTVQECRSKTLHVQYCSFTVIITYQLCHYSSPKHRYIRKTSETVISGVWPSSTLIIIRTCDTPMAYINKGWICHFYKADLIISPF